MKGKKLNVKRLMGILFLMASLIMAGIRLTMDPYDYSGAAAFDIHGSHDNRAVFVEIEALEESFAHDDELLYCLGYGGSAAYVIALPAETLEALRQKEHFISSDQLLMIFDQPQMLTGCSQSLSSRLRKLIMDEYHLDEAQLGQNLGESFLAVGQPVNRDKAAVLTAGAAILLTAGIACLLKKGKRTR